MLVYNKQSHGIFLGKRNASDQSRNENQNKYFMKKKK